MGWPNKKGTFGLYCEVMMRSTVNNCASDTMNKQIALTPVASITQYVTCTMMEKKTASENEAVSQDLRLFLFKLLRKQWQRNGKVHSHYNKLTSLSMAPCNCNSGFKGTEKFYALKGNLTLVSCILSKHHTTRPLKQLSTMTFTSLWGKHVLTLLTKQTIGWWIL